MSPGGARVGVTLLAALVAWGAAAAESPRKRGPESHAKASSYAPQPRPRNRAYGAPIQKPILAKHKRPKRGRDHSPSKP